MPARLVLAASTIAALLFANQVWLDYRYVGTSLSWWKALGISAADWYLWALLTPAVAWLGTRWPLGARTWRKALVVHVPTGLLIAMLKVSVDRVAGAAIAGGSPGNTSSLKLFMAVLTYWAILGAAAALAQNRDRRAQALRASQMENELTRAQLETLRTRIQPHFLFNTLNAISALMREDVEAADLMLTRLSHLLRLTLQRAPHQTVSFEDELEFTRHYLSIQEARFGDRLTVAADVDPAALALRIPTLLLQPLVENAFQHGVADKVGPVRVTIRAHVNGERLDVEVEDSGPGPINGWQSGVGLSTTRDRLRHLYGSRASLALDRGGWGGAIVRVSLPAETAA